MEDLTDIAQESPMLMQLMRADGRRGLTGLFWELSEPLQSLLRRIVTRVLPLSLRSRFRPVSGSVILDAPPLSPPGSV